MSNVTPDPTLARIIARLESCQHVDQTFSRNTFDAVLEAEGIMLPDAPPETKSLTRGEVKKDLNKATMNGDLQAPWYALEFTRRGKGQLKLMSRMVWECYALVDDVRRVESTMARLAKASEAHGDRASADGYKTALLWARKRGQLEVAAGTMESVVNSMRRSVSAIESLLEAEAADAPQAIAGPNKIED